MSSESPFLADKLFRQEIDHGLEPRHSALVAQSPFQRPFERSTIAPASPGEPGLDLAEQVAAEDFAVEDAEDEAFEGDYSAHEGEEDDEEEVSSFEYDFEDFNDGDAFCAEGDKDSASETTGPLESGALIAEGPSVDWIGERESAPQGDATFAEEVEDESHDERSLLEAQEGQVDLTGGHREAPALLDERSVLSVAFPSGKVLSVVTGLPEGKQQDYWDPTGSGNPLLNTGPAYKDVMLSANFSVRELTTSGGVSADVARIDPKLVECLQRLRDQVGRAIRVTSGYRSWKRNKQVYAGRKNRDGTPKKPTLSQHCGGRAVDINIRGLSGLDIGKAAVDACGPDIGIGLGAAFAHIDVRGRAAVWNYGGAKDSWVAELKRYQRGRGSVPKSSATSAKPEASMEAFLPQWPDFSKLRKWMERIEYIPKTGAPRSKEGIKSKMEVIGYADHDKTFEPGTMLHQRVKDVARIAGIDPGFLAATLVAESGPSTWSKTIGEVNSEKLGLDDWFEKYTSRYIKKAIAAVPTLGFKYTDIRETGEVWDTSTEKKGGGLKPRGVLAAAKAVAAVAMYINGQELMMQQIIKNNKKKYPYLLNSIRDLPPEKLYALQRNMFNEGIGRGFAFFRSLSRGEDIPRTGGIARDQDNPQRTAVLHMARAIHLAQAVFGQSPLRYWPAPDTAPLDNSISAAVTGT